MHQLTDSERRYGYGDPLFQCPNYIIYFFLTTGIHAKVLKVTLLKDILKCITWFVSKSNLMVPFLIIIPGILEREQEQSVVYGSIDFGKTVVTHAKYMDLLQKAGSQLKILPHTVINDKDEEVRGRS